MGWGSGSVVADAVWDVVKKYIPEEDHEEVADQLIEVFEDEDCDTMMESTLWAIAGRSDEDEEEDDSVELEEEEATE
jgi:hypothetical protein